MQVRDARHADAERIVQMVGRPAAHHGDMPALTTEALQRDMSDPPWIHVIVAEATLIGYAAMCPLIQLQVGQRGLDMHHLFVEAEFRGRGTGRALVEGCIAKARALGCDYLTVGTHPDNGPAQAFYESLGFIRKQPSPRFSRRL